MHRSRSSGHLPHPLTTVCVARASPSHPHDSSFGPHRRSPGRVVARFLALLLRCSNSQHRFCEAQCRNRRSPAFQTGPRLPSQLSDQRPGDDDRHHRRSDGRLSFQGASFTGPGDWRPAVPLLHRQNRWRLHERSFSRGTPFLRCCSDRYSAAARSQNVDLCERGNCRNRPGLTPSHDFQSRRRSSESSRPSRDQRCPV